MGAGPEVPKEASLSPNIESGRANPVRLAISPGAPHGASNDLASYLGKVQAEGSVGFSISRNARNVPTEIVLHPGAKPEVAGAVIEALRQRNIITEAEKTTKLEQLGRAFQNSAPAELAPTASPEQFSVDGRKYRLDMRESEVTANAGKRYVAELAPLAKVTPEQLASDTQKLKALLSAGLPKGSVTNVQEVSAGYGYQNNGDVKARGANKLYISAEISPDRIVASLPRETPAAQPPAAFRISKSQDIRIAVGGTSVATEAERGEHRSANGYSLKTAAAIVAEEGLQPHSPHEELSVRRPHARAGTSAFGLVDAKTSMVMTRAAMLRQALYATKDLMDGDFQGAAQNGGGIGAKVGMDAMNKKAAELAEELASRQAKLTAEGMSKEMAEITAKEGSGKIMRLVVSSVEVGGKKIPLLGAVVAAGFGTYEIYTTVAGGHKTSWAKVATTGSAVLGETAGSFFGFAGGEIGREAVVMGTGLIVDEKNRAHHSSTVEVAKELMHSYKEAKEWDANQLNDLNAGFLQASRNNRAAESLAALGVKTGRASLSDAADSADRGEQLAKLEWSALEAQGQGANVPSTPENQKKMSMDAAQVQTVAALHPDKNLIPIMVTNVPRLSDGAVASQTPDVPEGVRQLFAEHPEYRYINMPMYRAEAMDANGALKPDAKPFALKRYVSPELERSTGVHLSAQFTPPIQPGKEAQLKR